MTEDTGIVREAQGFVMSNQGAHVFRSVRERLGMALRTLVG